MQTLTSIRRHGWSGRMISLPLYFFYLAIQRSVAFGVILSLLFCFFCTVEDISTQDGAIGMKFWLRVEQTSWTGTR